MKRKMLAGLDAAIRSCGDLCCLTVATYDYAQLVANLATGTTMFRGTNIGAWTNLVCFAPGVDPAA